MWCCSLVITIFLISSSNAFFTHRLESNVKEVHRMKRQTVNNNTDLPWYHCCNTKPQLVENETDKKCAQYSKAVIANITDGSEFVQQSYCETECHFNEENLINADGSMNITAVVENSIIALPDAKISTWVKTLVETKFNECLALATKEAETLNNSTVCNRIPLGLVYCLWRQMQLQCPNGLRNDGEFCTSVRNVLTLNDKLFLA